MEQVIKQGCAIAAIMWPLYNFDTLYEWGKLLRLPLFRFEELKKINEDADNLEKLNYFTFIQEYYGSSFLAKLVSCPYCLGVWIALLTCLCFGNVLDWFPTVFFYFLGYGLLDKLSSYGSSD